MLRLISVFVIFIALILFLVVTSPGKIKKRFGLDKKRGGPFRLVSAILLAAVGLAALLSNKSVFLKLYPVLMNAVLFSAFFTSLFFQPSFVFRFAVLMDKSIRGSLTEKRVEKYCWKVTLVWCIFFTVNGSIAAWTIYYGSNILWSVYNGGISYILIGALSAVELFVRKIVEKKMPRAVPLSQLKAASRPGAYILCYERFWGDGKNKTWTDLLEDSARLRLAIRRDNADKWILYADDYWFFLCALTALLQCQKEIHLSPDVSPAVIHDMRQDGNTGFLTDQTLTEEEAAGKITSIPLLLSGPLPAEAEPQSIPPVNANDARIILYNMESPGQFKSCSMRLTDLEEHNRFLLSWYGEQWLARKVCSTVSQRHLDAMLFAILLPWTAGVPFRRHRIETPAEFERLEYSAVTERQGGAPKPGSVDKEGRLLIITEPEFLKQAVEMRAAEGNPPWDTLNKPWIFSIGAIPEKSIAEKVNEVFGFWPLEVYGYMETLSIARRLSRDGPEWTPFENKKISINSGGFLVVRGTSVEDAAEFVSGDMAEILSDGRFLLKGRADSVESGGAADVMDTRGISPVNIIERDTGKIILEFSVLAESDYFDDHFPDLKVLAAVAQFELAVRLANRYLHTSLFIEKAKRMKWTTVIRPGVPLRLELVQSSLLVSFTYTSPDGQIVYSTGSFTTVAGGQQ